MSDMNKILNLKNKTAEEISQILNLELLQLAQNNIHELPKEIGKLQKLKSFYLYGNYLNKLPKEIGQLKKLEIFNLSGNDLNELPKEICQLQKLTSLYLSGNYLNELPEEIGQLQSLKLIDLSRNCLDELPKEIGKLQNLEILNLSENNLTELPEEIGQLQNLKSLYLSGNYLTELPKEIGQLKKLKLIDLSLNSFDELPKEIIQLQNLEILHLAQNNLKEIPKEITKLTKLISLDLSKNNLVNIPPEIVARGVIAIFTYLKQLKTIEHNEAKMILLGNGEVGKTCLVDRLIKNKFIKGKITEGINRKQWTIVNSVPDNPIILNIWDFGGQEIYHATHQFFLTKRTVYILVWNARKTKDYDTIYYWLHMIESFGENSPIILVMSKLNESDDDLNLEDLKSKFNIVDYLKIDSEDGKGIDRLKESITNTSLNLPLMKTIWIDSWYKVRKQLEKIEKNYISYDDFYTICHNEGLDDDNIIVLDEYFNDLGLILHYKDVISLKDIIILKPEWATNAFYKILSSKAVLDLEGMLELNELDNIWDKTTYPSSLHFQIMELMNKFELSYQIPYNKNYLIPQLLPRNQPKIEWDMRDNLYFVYKYDSFLPSAIITRFIVRMHQNIEKKSDGMPNCWREGVILSLENSRAFVKIKNEEKQIEIRIKGFNKRGALGAICNQLDQINCSISKIKYKKEIFCNCSESCTEKYSYEKLLKDEAEGRKTIQCHESYTDVSISSLLDGYIRREERLKGLNYNDVDNNLHLLKYQKRPYDQFGNFYIINENKSVMESHVNTNISINLKVELTNIKNEFNDFKNEIEHLDQNLSKELEKIQDSLDEVSSSSEKEKLNKPFNKLYRVLIKMGDSNSEYNKLIKGTEKALEYTQKLVNTYNKFAQWLDLSMIDLFKYL